MRSMICAVRMRKPFSVEEMHSVLEDLLGQIIESTRNVHTTVTTSQDDLQQIRDSIGRLCR